jgi:hypothetical protein
MKARQPHGPKQNFIPRSDRPDLNLGQQSRLNQLQVRDLDAILGKKFAHGKSLKELNDKSDSPVVLDKGNEKTHRDGCDFLLYSFSGGQDLQCYFETTFPIADYIRKGPHGSVRRGTNFAGNHRQHSSVKLSEASAHFPAADAVTGTELESVAKYCDK